MQRHHPGTRSVSALFVIAAGVALAPVDAAAQIPPPAQPGAPPPAMEPPSESPVPPADPGLQSETPGEPLSEKLKRGEGVLEPPRSIDPGMTQPVPEEFESKTPVIPPPRDADGAPRDAEPDGAAPLSPPAK
ncbi:signal peptide protein [Hyphomicrobium nitrativorans NL23]|uniref:Signal peptide protein n=1 Tax=Hyphomicrobium nitrativorans NL23 TaxID=1029756 RepID=V5SBE6_9HYPH|nr:hypothetical protein [Hyphomicrobium nitrativorans]AHB47797.1 signal peptide protein [Hyphomicrobium nitrativorans NL23]